MKTVNRGWLKRQVAAGKVEVLCLRDFMTPGYTRDNEWSPAFIKGHMQETRDGQVGFDTMDFRFSSGRAYWDGKGQICFNVMRGLGYLCRITNA